MRMAVAQAVGSRTKPPRQVSEEEERYMIRPRNRQADMAAPWQASQRVPVSSTRRLSGGVIILSPLSILFCLVPAIKIETVV